MNDFTETGRPPETEIRPLDGSLQPDPQLREGPASTSRVVLSIAVLAIVIGGVIYGLTKPDLLHDRAAQGMTAQTQQARKDADKSSDLPEFKNVPPTFTPNPAPTTGAATR